MVNWDFIALVIFFGILFVIFKVFRNKFDIEHKIFVMLRTKMGLKFMKNFANKFPRLLKILGYIGVVVGFLGMAFIVVFLVKETINYILIPGTPLPIQPVFPGIKIAGLPTVSFFHWIIAILILATIHEASHGILSIVHKVPIKSSGFAFLGPIMAAFVEPDDQKLSKKKPMQQLSVFAAGPFSNIIAGVVILFIFIFLISPIIPAITEPAGITVIDIDEGPLMGTDISVPFEIQKVNGVDVVDTYSYLEVVNEVKPGEFISLETEQGTYAVVTEENPLDKEKSYLGITIKQELSWNDGWEWVEPFYPVINWVIMLFFWLWIFNIGVGLFNLLPFSIVDGGRMFYVASLAILKDKKKAMWAFKFMSMFILFVIILLLYVWLHRKVMGFLAA